jgi:hypothetical protein
VVIPEIAGYDEGEWTPFTWSRLTIEGSNCREIVDNVVDMAHFFYTHYSFPVYFKNVFEGHIASQHMNTKPRPDVDIGTNYSREKEAIGRSEAAYYGPSYMIDYLWNESPVGCGPRSNPPSGRGSSILVPPSDRTAHNPGVGLRPTEQHGCLRNRWRPEPVHHSDRLRSLTRRPASAGYTVHV